MKINKPEREAYNLDYGRAVKAAVSCPVMSVGGFRTTGVIEKALKEVDFVCTGVDHERVQQGEAREPRRLAAQIRPLSAKGGFSTPMTLKD